LQSKKELETFLLLLFISGKIFLFSILAYRIFLILFMLSGVDFYWKLFPMTFSWHEPLKFIAFEKKRLTERKASMA